MTTAGRENCSAIEFFSHRTDAADTLSAKVVNNGTKVVRPVPNFGLDGSYGFAIY